MRIAYLDCFAGISGDMLLGALIGAGVPARILQDAASALNLGATLKVESLDRSGISSIKVHVLENGHLAEAHTKHNHTHEHLARAHPHQHSRSLNEIRALIHAAPLPAAVKSFAVEVFQLLGQSEAKIHNIPIEKIHFHEVGAVDTIVDIVAASTGIHYLRIGAWHASPVNVGGGMISCAHGSFPVPAPAAADLLCGFPTYSASIQHELTTPSGAALLRALNPAFGPQPAMRVSAIGYGAGTRNPAGFPNVLRLSIGEAVSAAAPDSIQSPALNPSTSAAHSSSSEGR